MPDELRSRMICALQQLMSMYPAASNPDEAFDLATSDLEPGSAEEISERTLVWVESGVDILEAVVVLTRRRYQN